MRRQRETILTALTAGVLVAGAVAPLSGCRGDRSNKPPRQFFPDLDEQPRYEAQRESKFFEDYTDEETGERYGRTQREPVAGTVPFGRTMHVEEVAGIDWSDRAEFLREDDAWAQGRTYRVRANGAPVLNDEGQPAFDWVEDIPMQLDRAGAEDLIATGKKKYNIYCLPCHGGTGDGQGLVGQRWNYALPNFHDALYQKGGEKGQDGYIFHTIRNGVANVGGPYPLKMPGYARKLTIDETWAVVAYFRALQRTRQGTVDDLSETQRIQMERGRTGTASNDGSNQ